MTTTTTKEYTIVGRGKVVAGKQRRLRLDNRKQYKVRREENNMTIKKKSSVGVWMTEGTGGGTVERMCFLPNARMNGQLLY